MSEVKKARSRRKRGFGSKAPSEPQLAEDHSDRVIRQVVDGEELEIELTHDGVFKRVITKRPLRKDVKGKARYWKLPPMPRSDKGTRLEVRYIINAGEGKRNLRFWQRNWEDEAYDPKKENVVAVVDPEVNRMLATENRVVEVFDYDPDSVKADFEEVVR